MKYLSTIAGMLVLCGCATGTDGVVPIGPDLYMIGGLGKFTDYSSSAAKARLFQEGSKFCQERGRTMYPVNSTGRDSGIGTYATAEIQFLCLMPGDARLATK